MPSPHHHPDCPRCKGEGFYLKREGQGYMRDGSFSHNQWEDCRCHPDMEPRELPKSLDPPPRYILVEHIHHKGLWMWGVIIKGNITQKHKLTAIGLDGVEPWTEN